MASNDAAFTPLPDDRPVRWGMLATGSIAHTITEDLALIPDDAVVTAVGSRTRERAEAFAAQHHIPAAHGSYEELANDPDVDVVHITTPHSHHFDAARVCIEAGKHVLVEKPLSDDPAATRELLALAEEHHVFCMEAMWTRCSPLVRHAFDLVSSGTLGAVRHVSACFSFPFHGSPEHRLANPALAGGAILDLGVYPAHLAHLFLGAPTTIMATGSRLGTGVDGHAVAQLTWASTPDRPAATAQLMASLTCGPSQSATISCEGGSLEFRDGFTSPHVLTIRPVDDGEPAIREAHFDARGYTFQAQEVARCLRAGLLHSPLVPPSSTIEVADLLAAWQAGIPA